MDEVEDTPPPAPADDLLALTLEVAGSLDARTVMRRILERSLSVAGADRATLSSFVGDRLVIEASVGTGGEVTWEGRGYEPESLERQPLVQRLLETREAVLGGPMTTARALPEFREALDRVKHTATVPVLEAGELVGMLLLSRYQERAFVESDVPSLTAFGALAGLALRNAKLYEEATAAARRLQAAAEAAADAAALQDLPALLQRIIEHACEAAGADSAAIMRVEGNEGVVEATSGVAPLGSRWPLAEAIRDAIDAGRPIVVDAALTGVDSQLEPYVSPYSHALVAPLRFSADVLGILVLGRYHGREEFSADDVAGLRQFATLAALVLHSARLVHRLREAERMKRDFMNIAVHELRGPLTVIEGYTELLMRDEGSRLDDETTKQLATIRRQAAHARTLAEDLLILARIESRDLGVARDVMGIGEVVSAATERALPRARLRAGTIEMSGTDAAQAVGDTALVSRVLDNLLSNAIAYSVRRPVVRLSISVDGDMVQVRVQDNGPGITDEDRDRIFARFARGSGHGAVEGSGLGLYLSRECAQVMGGDLVLEESGAAGSRFVLTLPAA
ncbi:MAG TPA: GAF domain-containing sensor histidine kinase [Candidatus Deferrimicrobium sp.]|nr:GAF domain-containing sensor histidine kinase [Candidatus Deferrimicrobium sp.]